jgi:drug/metabolite transporter (DMT)-like permease
MATPNTHRLQILAAALLFSTGGAVIKATTLTSWQVACFRSGLAALSLALLMPSWHRIWRPRTLLVGLAYAATMICYVSANKLTTAANTIFLQSTAPMYLLLLGPWWLREKIRAADLAFVASLALGMTMFFVGAETPVATAPDPVAGNVVAALSGASWALTILGLRWLGRKGDKGDADESAGAAVVAGNLITFLVCLAPAVPVHGAAPRDWLVVVYLGVFQIGLAYIFLTRGVRGVPALETSLLLLLEPVLNAVWAWLVHGERPGPWSLGGCAIILGATIVRTLRRAEPDPG